MKAGSGGRAEGLACPWGLRAVPGFSRANVWSGCNTSASGMRHPRRPTRPDMLQGDGEIAVDGSVVGLERQDAPEPLPMPRHGVPVTGR